MSASCPALQRRIGMAITAQRGEPGNLWKVLMNWAGLRAVQAPAEYAVAGGASSLSG